MTERFGVRVQADGIYSKCQGAGMGKSLTFREAGVAVGQ